MGDIRRTLIVGPAWVGDMVMAQSLFRTLQAQYPEIQIDVLAPAWSAPILKRMPEVHRHIDMPLGHGEFGLVARYRLGKSLRDEAYDQAIVIPRSFKAALVPFFANIPQRTGYKGEMRFGLLNDIRSLDKNILKQTVQRYVALGLSPDASLPPSCPQPDLQVNAVSVEKSLCEFQLTLDSPVLALCPGAEYGPAKCWPVEHYAEVARAKISDGWQVWLFGSGKEQALAENIRQLAPGCINLAGKTSMEQAIDLMSVTNTVVSNDSGLMHVAAALSRNMVVIYGSSDPAYTPPLSEKAVVEYLGLECSPCFQRTCRFGHYHCLTDIKPQQVLSSMNQFAGSVAR